MDHCAICGSALMVSVSCRLEKGPVCESHCKKCFYFEELTWHCSYYNTKIAPAQMRPERQLPKRYRRK